jgi:hypothetical protein
MKTFPQCAAALALSAALGLPAQAATFHLSGEFAAQNDVVVIPFTLEEDADTVRMWTDSFRDGQGVDPLLALWDARGDLIDWNDDNDTLAPAQTSGDAGLYFSPLAAGDYFLTLTGGGNLPWGGNLSDGFTYDLDPAAPPFGADPHWSVWLDAPQARVPGVPEPPTVALFALGMLVVLAGRRRRRAFAGRTPPPAASPRSSLESGIRSSLP